MIMKNIFGRFIKKYPQIFFFFLPSEKGFKLGKTELGYSSLRDKKELKKS